MFRSLQRISKFPIHQARFLSESAKQPRAARRNKVAEQTNTKISPGLLGVLAFSGIVGYAVYDIDKNPNGQIAELYRGSYVEKAVKMVYKMTFGRFNEIFLPASDKLLPDYKAGPFYGNIPPGAQPPPLLVVDLERTLIGSVYDSRYGWRHVKRPGLDKFIKDLSQYYEIVIHSENDVGAATEILMAIDPEGRTHKLGNAAAEVRGETILKRLDLMNRDMNKIILIDDNPESAQLFPRNTLFVEPFTNVENKSDTVLLELIPFLQALVHEDVQDYRETFDKLGTRQAEEAVVEYQMRLAKKKREEQDKRNRGIGSLIRGQKESTEDEFFIKSSVPSPKDIVGRSPDVPEVSASLGLKPKVTQNNEPKQPVAKKKGALFSYLDEVEKNKEEDEKRKREKWQEIQMARHFAKMKAEEESKNAQE